MDLQHLTLALDAKAVAEDGTITGYGAIFGNVDEGGDIILPGAFAASLKKRLPKMLLHHDERRPIGLWDEAAEDGNGLKVKGHILTTVPDGATAYELAGLALPAAERRCIVDRSGA